MRRRRTDTFSEVVARLRERPPRAPEAAEGRHGDSWGDQEHRRYELVTNELSPERAVELARSGAKVVYDACGCGGAQCRLDWLSADEVAALAVRGAPRLHPSKHGRADLEHWRGLDGHDLIVVAVEVTWGGRIRG